MKWQRAFFEEALLVFEAWDPSVEWYIKVATAVLMQSSATLSSVTRKKRTTYPDITGSFFQQGR